jgi:hypothetical protein|tara:strand:- start:41 stop:1642 length:1602 start_codon:yes stop_codon:yes gene_type:complete
MATIKQLEKALLKAEEAGNTDDVNEIKQLIFNKESQSSLAGGIARSAGQGLTFGFGDEIVAGVKAPFTDKTYREELELERAKLENFRQQNPKTALASEIAGSIAIPFAGGAGRAVTKGLQKAGDLVTKNQLGNLATQGAVASGVYGVGTADEDTSVGDIAKQTVTGAIANPVVARTAQKLLNPQILDDAKKLMDKGTELTVGQKLGGVTKEIEDLTTSVPIMGGGIKQSRQQSIDSFNRSAINETLKPINKTLPKNVEVGTDAVNYMDDAISQNYTKLVPKSDIEIDDIFLNTIKTTQKAMEQTNRSKAFNSFVKDEILKPIKNKKLSGESYKELYSKLGKEIKQYRKAFDKPDLQKQADNLQEIKNALGNNLARQKPNIAKQISATDSAYNMAQRIIGASAKNKEGGAFTPNQLLQEVRKQDFSRNKKMFAKGKLGELQTLGQSGERILPSNIPNSGTSDRGALLGLGGIGYFDPITALTLGGVGYGGRLMTSPIGQRMLSGLLTQRPQAVRNLGDRTQQISPFVVGGLLTE